MSLPVSDAGSDKVTLSGGYVEIRGLTITEHEVLQKLDGAAQNILAISYATGEPQEDVKAWYATASAKDVKIITDAIGTLSGLDTGATFPGRTGDDAVAARQGT